MTVLEYLAHRFPQIYLKPAEGVSLSPLYRAIVRKGMAYTGDLSHFTGSCEDEMAVEHTPMGDVLSVFLKKRSDFETLYRIMACRCEPVAIPATMGAAFIGGFNDWSRIREHMSAYRAAGGDDPDGEFARFTAVSDNYKGSLLLLSDGPYSAIPHQQTPYGREDWRRLSLTIRKYHELTHFLCRKAFPHKKYPIWDELLADFAGLVAAVGKYDRALACTFLGLEQDRYVGGRLENYLASPVDRETVCRINAVLTALEQQSPQQPICADELFALVLRLEDKAEELFPDPF